MKAVFALLFLTGCASSGACVCPQIQQYSRVEQLNQAATEATLPSDSPLVQPLLEWAKLRQELKACNGGQ